MHKAEGSSPFRLILISPPTTTAAEAPILQCLFEAGLQTFHLRKPGASAAEVEAYLQAMPQQYHRRIVLHGHYELAQHYSIGGLHLPAAARTTWAAQAHLRQPVHSLSTSFHSLTELRRHRRRYEYVFLSPIFDSISKQDYGQAFALAEVQQELQRLQQRRHYAPQVVALGGITADTIAQVRAAGFAGAAVLGSVWQAADPVAALRQLL
ncbi:thiamine phosphate synthase [Hymenobacter aerilatus]|uniref:Thiamine phosphate synthase n=1 Tax=Hymenobacter aerilatus TaxID=2932251 RepID=A0A8T9SXT9_9BACT|nr:thiamine phosphate synthase [Hymenobacter aerilatus]UOR05000.1 thiamine phosphate synthase [Hymenobacter aerilatus]